jgi:predicted phage replisome organizer
MAEVKWIKITTTMFDDEKINFIESLPEADTLIIIWVKLLTLAGKCNAGGYVLLTENIPYTDEMLAHKFQRPLNIIKLALDTFQRLEMIEIDNRGIYITNWDKHQNLEGLERIKEQTRQRVAKHRENKLLTSRCNVTSNVTVTHGNATDIDIDIDLDKEEDKEINIIHRNLLHTLKNIKDWPFDYNKDLEHIKSLEVDFPQIDLLDEVQRFKAYKLDKPLKQGSNARLQLRNWCANAIKFKRTKQSGGFNLDQKLKELEDEDN